MCKGILDKWKENACGYYEAICGLKAAITDLDRDVLKDKLLHDKLKLLGATGARKECLERKIALVEERRKAFNLLRPSLTEDQVGKAKKARATIEDHLDRLDKLLERQEEDSSNLELNSEMRDITDVNEDVKEEESAVKEKIEKLTELAKEIESLKKEIKEAEAEKEKKEEEYEDTTIEDQTIEKKNGDLEKKIGDFNTLKGCINLDKFIEKLNELREKKKAKEELDKRAEETKTISEYTRDNVVSIALSRAIKGGQVCTPKCEQTEKTCDPDKVNEY
jgi:chromosome segregation ATPase